MPTALPISSPSGIFSLFMNTNRRKLIVKKGKKSEIDSLINEIIKFRDERNWKQFHNTKDLALGLFIEAGELNEQFLWKNNQRVDIKKLKEELADVLIYALLLSEKHNIDVKKIVIDKIKQNKKKYPVEKARNSAKKYNEL